MSVESINSTSIQSPTVSVEKQVDSAVKTENIKAASPSKSDVDKVFEPGEVKDAVAKLNEFISSSTQRDLSFSIDESTKEMVVVVTDRLTDEVIRQMPTEEALAVAKQIESMLGLIVNDTA